MVTSAASATGRFRRIRMVVTFSLSLFFLWMADPWHYYFLNDDFLAIPRAAGGQFIYGDLLRPVSDLTLWLDHFIWGKDPAGYHITNLLIHVLNSTLIFFLSVELFTRFGKKDQSATLKSWLASLLFLLYSSHSEPLFWIIGRGGSLSTLFFLICCITFLRRRHSSWYLLLCYLSFFLGLLVYEAIWIFPLVAALLTLSEWLTERRKPDRSAAAWTPLAVLTGLFFVYLGLRWWLTGHIAGAYELRDLSIQNPGRLIYNYSTLLGRCLLPPMTNGKWFAGCYLLALLLLALAIRVTLRKNKGKILPVLLGLGLLLALLPAAGLGIDTHTTESERFIYLPSVFWVLLLVELLSTLIPRPALFIRVCIIVTLANAFGLWQSSLSYRYAGEVARHSLSCLGSAPGAGSRPAGPMQDRDLPAVSDTAKADSPVLYVIHLPDRYKGALIFRMGFGEALRWMNPGYDRAAIRILSRSELKSRQSGFTCEEGDPIAELRSLHALNLTLPPPGSDSGATVDLGDTTFSFRPKKDQIVGWTDSSLIRIGFLPVRSENAAVSFHIPSAGPRISRSYRIPG